MRLYRNQLAIRIGGTLIGLGFLAVAGYALLGGAGIDAALRQRADGFGLAALVAGLWAVAVSWLDPDLSGVWCRQPRRRRKSSTTEEET
ncbi:MAG: hypothetical protein H6983_02920 [Ectothiorhodospiraceae bacterium]|nr:hypothetical protein [Ectothiorhodospiraceae bacterium]